MNRDERTAHELAEELAGLGVFDVTFKPSSVFALVALLQLALRHPGTVPGPTREVAEAFIRGARTYFADCPTVLDVIDKGDDPAHDR